MIPFTLETPRRIFFGSGQIKRLPEVLLGLRRILIVSGRQWFTASGAEKRVKGLLRDFELSHVACVQGEPRVDTLEAVRGEAEGSHPEAIVGIGGGSVLDTAKALSVLVGIPGRVEEYMEGGEGAKEIAGPGIPWVAIPTTAGTGAEATKNAVVRSVLRGVKRSIRSHLMLASSVIVDPELTVELPLRTTGISGLDALTQLVEAYVSKNSTPPVRSLIEGSFALMFDALKGLPDGLGRIDLRSDASYGALVSGIALANSGLGAAHGFAAAIGGAYDIPHGLLCAVLLPHVLEANAPVIRDDISVLIRERAGGKDPVEWLSDAVRGFLAAFELPLDLKRYRIPGACVRELAERSSGSSMKGNPRELGMREKEALLSRVI
jgi:alcohol dehydrogenase class IV